MAQAPPSVIEPVAAPVRSRFRPKDPPLMLAAAAFIVFTLAVVLAANTQGFAVAVPALGVRPVTVYARHILPFIASVLMVQHALTVRRRACSRSR